MSARHFSPTQKWWEQHSGDWLTLRNPERSPRSAGIIQAAPLQTFRLWLITGCAQTEGGTRLPVPLVPTRAPMSHCLWSLSLSLSCVGGVCCFWLWKNCKCANYDWTFEPPASWSLSSSSSTTTVFCGSASFPVSCPWKNNAPRGRSIEIVLVFVFPWLYVAEMQEAEWRMRHFKDSEASKQSRLWLNVRRRKRTSVLLCLH